MMRRFAEEMDRRFGGWPGTREEVQSVWPPLEVYEEGNTLNIRADLPAMKPEDIKVEVTDVAVTIRGERKNEREERKEGIYRSERTYGAFCRTIPLPEGANPEEAKAEFRNGELRVTMPLSEAKKKGREIPISTG